MSLNNHQPQIKKLLLKKNDPNFNELFNQILFDKSPSDKFLIKMELNRLFKPCQRIIDLRGKVQQACLPFVCENIQHYLDKSSKEAFEDSIKIYGQYTVGTYESIINKHLKIKKQQTGKRTSANDALPENQQCELIYLAETNKRAAARMFFVSDVKLKLKGDNYLAKTTNISTSGLKIKLKKNIIISNGEIIRLSFSGLKKEYIEKESLSDVQYQVVGQQTLDNIQYFYLNYIDNNPQLITFIEEFIRINQYKYKIDVHYYYQLAKNKSLTNYYLASTGKLAVCLDRTSSTPFLFALENRVNKEVINYWQFQNKNQLLPLFNKLRLSRLLDSKKNHVETTLYSFIYENNGSSYYLSATEDELLDRELKELFIYYGHNKKNWRVYNLSIDQYSCDNQSVDPTMTLQQYELLDSITHIATLKDISHKLQLPDENTIQQKELNELNHFVHPEVAKYPDVFQLFPVERRQEYRYLYQSNIELKIAGNHYPAQLLNFSLSGLMIKLTTPLNVADKSRLTINLVDFQKIAKKSCLSELAYTVINSRSGNILNLKVADKKTEQITQHFFSALVRSNPAHFRIMPAVKEERPFTDELKKIAEASHLDGILFVMKEKHLFNIKYASLNKQNSALKTLFTLMSDHRNEINVTPITNNHLYKRLISQPLKTGKRNAVLKETLIYIKVQQNRRQEWKIKSYLEEDFSCLKERDNFIEYSKLSSQIYVLHYRLISLEAPDLSVIEHEINAISRSARHLTKKLEEELHAVRGLIEITDCSKFFEKISLQQ